MQLRTAIAAFLFLSFSQGCLLPAAVDSIEVDVQVDGWLPGIRDTLHLTVGRNRATRVSGDLDGIRFSCRDVRDVRTRLKDLQRQNRQVIHTPKRDVDIMNKGLELGEYNRTELRQGLNNIRKRRLGARVGLNVVGLLKQIVEDPDLTARWAPPVRDVLVVNRNCREMAVDVRDSDTVQVGYTPVFSGFKQEDIPSEDLFGKMAKVKVTVAVHDSATAAQVFENHSSMTAGGGSLLEVGVSDLRGRASGLWKGDDSRGVLVFPSVLVPRSGRLILDGAEPVSERDIESVQVVRIQDGTAVQEALREAEKATSSGVNGAVSDGETASADLGPASYREGVRKLDEGDLESALTHFKATVGEDTRHAHAYMGMADAYFRQMNFKDAKFYYNKALKRDPELTMALWKLGDLAFVQEDWVAAKNVYGKILTSQPEHLFAMFRRAIAYRENGKSLATVFRWMEWRRSEQFFRVVATKDPLFEDVHYQHAILKRYQGQYKKAILLGEKQVALKSEIASIRLGLFRLYYHYLDNKGTNEVLAWLQKQNSPTSRYFVGEALRYKGEFVRADSVLNTWIGSNPKVSVAPAFLSLARIAFQDFKPQIGEVQFWRAVDSIQDSLDAQLVYQDVKYIVNLEEMSAFQEITTVDDWKTFFRKIWVSRDPTPSVEWNARLSEHYRRLLYVERHYLFDGFRTWFNDPDKFDNLDFLETTDLNDRFNDKGLVYVRHGEASDIQKPMDLREVWWYWKTKEYPEMVFNFAASPTAVGSNWRLVESALGSGNLSARVRWDVEKRIRKVRRSVSEGLVTDRHTWDEKVDALDYESYLAFFKGDEGKNSVELYYGIELKELKKVTKELVDTDPVFEYGFALHDLDWNRFVNQNGTVTLSNWDAISYEDWGIGTVKAQGNADSCQAAFFLRPSSKSLLGGWKGGIRIPEISSTELDMSSVVPAYEIDPDKETEDVFSSRGIHMVPNPSRRFPRKEPVYVYFELYNLTPSESGLTSFEVEYTLTQLRHKGIRKLLSIFGSGKKPTTAVSVERLGETRDSAEYLSLDLSRAGRGDFRLDIKVKDRNAGTEKETSLELVLH